MGWADRDLGRGFVYDDAGSEHRFRALDEPGQTGGVVARPGGIDVATGQERGDASNWR